MLPMKGSKGRAVMLWGIGRRTKIPLPGVLVACSLFFLAGLYGSLLFSQVPSGDGSPRGRELEEDEGRLTAAMDHGETGESRPAPMTFQVLSWKPRALFFPQFATPEQCQTIIKLAKSRLKPSTLALRKGETAESTKGVRTSSGTFISAFQDLTGTLDIIEEKIARATMIPREHGEAFNVLRYEIGQMYASHFDVFNPAEYGPQKSQRVLKKSSIIQCISGNTEIPSLPHKLNMLPVFTRREFLSVFLLYSTTVAQIFYTRRYFFVASFLLYLSDVEEGGETMFPFENGNMDVNYDFHKCIGLKVKPRQGDGLLFYSLLSNGTIDPTSLHGSCPVVKGEKWVATKWIRDQDRTLM